MTAAPALAATIAAAAIAANNHSTVATAHHVEWQRASSTEPSLNGNYTPRMWSVRNVLGEKNLYPGQPNLATNNMSAMDFFLLMFPPQQLVAMVDLTNIELEKLEANTTNTLELLKLFGVLILMPSFEFTSRASLWSSVAPMKCGPAPHFGLTGMSNHRFDDLFRAIRWSKQPSERAENESTEEQHRWKLVDDFVANFNDHRANYFTPSNTICVDESMSRWFGQGGHWINHGLPQYVAIERKPENGCKIQNSACGRSRVMLRLKLVKGIDLVGEEDNDEPNNDSYFTSVGATKELYQNGLRFIGIVKTATRGFPKAFLTSVELNQCGDFFALVSDSADKLGPATATFVWMDRERRYFIATAGALSEGTPYTRCRWRQVVSQDRNGSP